MTPPRILFIDFAPTPGGSVQSLLLILRNLPADCAQPLALFSPAVANLPAVQALGMPVFSFDAGQGTAIPFRSGTAQVRQSNTADRLRQARWLGKMWRAGSMARRLWFRTRRTAAFIADLIEREQIDLVHLNDALPLAEPGILAAWRKRRPSIVVVRSFTPLDAFHGLISRLPAAGVFTSQPLQLDQQAQGARFRRQRVIANAVDLAAFEGVPDRSGLRREFGLAADVRVLAVVGRIMQRKGLDHFIRAVQRVAETEKNVAGLIIGGEDQAEPGLQDELGALAARLGLADKIVFAGFRADIPRLLLASDLLCFVPAQPEPFGRTVIEAMAAGLPVIGARSGAIPDILVEGKTGLLVPPADPGAQTAAILRLLADPAAAAQMGAAARARAAELYGIEQQVAALCALYAQTLGLEISG